MLAAHLGLLLLLRSILDSFISKERQENVVHDLHAVDV